MRHLVCGIAILMIANSDVRAEFLNGRMRADRPNLSIAGLAADYQENGASGSLNIDGTSPLAFYNAPDTLNDIDFFPVDPVNFELNATVDNTGVLHGGTVSISTDSLTFSLFGSLTHIASAEEKDQLDFLFEVTGGFNAIDYGGIGAIGGIRFVELDQFAGDPLWSVSWADTSVVGDAFGTTPVPEPTTAMLFGIGLLGFAGCRQFQRRR